MAGSEGPGPLRPSVAVAFGLVGFVALAIFGLGMTSLALDADVIAVEGLGQAPGVIGMLLASAVFAGSLWLSVRAQHPSFWSAPLVAAATVLGEAIGVFAGGIGTDVAAAAAAAGSVLIGWPGLVLFVAALIAAWGGIALVRTRSGRPRWPWERDDPED